MNILPGIIASLAIVVLAAGLMVWHLQAWQNAKLAGLDPQERAFRFRQFRRRMQISVMVGLIGIGSAVGQWLMIKPYRLLAIDYGPMTILFVWLVIVVLAAWVIALALVDVWATRVYFGRIRHELFLKQTTLKTKLQQMQSKSSEDKTSKRENQ